MKEKIKSAFSSGALYGVLMVIQYIAVVVFNFAYTDNAVDSDAAKLLRHAVEMSKNHTLNIKGWIHTTTMEWDTSALIAAPIYSVTHNVYLSFAIANAIIAALLICLILRLFDRFGVKLKTALMACNLILIPYAFGMLDYFNLLMFNGSQYVFRIMIPIILLIILKTPKEKRIGVENILLGILGLVLIIIASISSGVYIIVSCVLPVAAMVIWSVLKINDWKKYDLYQYLVCAVSLFAALIGTVISVKMGEAQIGNTMSLLRWYDLRYYMQCLAEGYFRLMGAMPGAVADESVAVFSLRGIAFLFKLILSVIMLIVLCAGVSKSIFGRSGEEVSDSDEYGRKELTYFLCGIALINLVVVAVCETRYNSQNTTLEYRYLLPAVVPLILCSALWIDNLTAKAKLYMKNFITAVFIIGVAYTTLICFSDAHAALDPYAYIYTIRDYVDASGYDTVIFLDDRPTAECLRLIDMDREYEAYSSSGSMDIVDYYEAAMYNDFYQPDHLFFVVSGTPLPDVIGSDKAAAYTYKETILWFDIYEAHEFNLGY